MTRNTARRARLSGPNVHNDRPANVAPGPASTAAPSSASLRARRLDHRRTKPQPSASSHARRRSRGAIVPFARSRRRHARPSRPEPKIQSTQRSARSLSLSLTARALSRVTAPHRRARPSHPSRRPARRPSRPFARADVSLARARKVANVASSSDHDTPSRVRTHHAPPPHTVYSYETPPPFPAPRITARVSARESRRHAAPRAVSRRATCRGRSISIPWTRAMGPRRPLSPSCDARARTSTTGSPPPRARRPRLATPGTRTRRV